MKDLSVTECDNTTPFLARPLKGGLDHKMRILIARHLRSDKAPAIVSTENTGSNLTIEESTDQWLARQKVRLDHDVSIVRDMKDPEGWVGWK